MSMAPPPDGGSGALTAEQLHRIEQNKKQAQERLAKKRRTVNNFRPPQKSGSNSGNFLGPPQSKRATSQEVHISPPIHSMMVKLCDSSKASCSSTSAPSSSLQPPDYVEPQSTHQSSRHDAYRPTTSMKLSSVSRKPTEAPPTSLNQSPICVNTGSLSTCKIPSNCQPWQSSSSSREQVQFVQWQKKVKANFVMTSKERFKVITSFDAKLIEMFKKMNTKSYDAKHATWSFGIEDYHHLVDAIKKECKHVEMNLVPKPVITLFQCRIKSAKNESGSPYCPVMEWNRINSKLMLTLMQFQKEGVEYSVKRGGRVLIADDMGLGKTLQAIAVMNYYREDWPLLVVCPSSVRLAWAQAFLRWIPSLNEDDVNVLLTVKNSFLNSLVTISSYDLAVRMAKELRQKCFKAIIADESHFLKNCKTARYKAIAPIVKKARRAILLSGTPALSRPIELFTQINMLDRNFKSISLTEFGIRYCNGVKGHFGWNFSGASNMSELQMYMEESIMIRRMKSDVLDQLPNKRRQMVLLNIQATKLRNKEWKDMRLKLEEAGKLKRMDRKNALLPLYEKTGRMKAPAINDYVLDLLEGGRKLIVFGHHRSVLDSVCEVLDTKSYGYIRIDGRTAAEVRQNYCDKFQYDEKCLVAVLSITAANTGLTLTASSTVVFAELFWNPGILIQAEDRAYRIGQHDSVNIHYLVAQNTVDDFIWPLIQLKLDILNQAGLAKEDFSKADSTTLKGKIQRNLFECFDELVSESDHDSLSAPDPDKKDQFENYVLSEKPIEDSNTTEQPDKLPESNNSMISELSPTSNVNVSHWFDNLTEDDFIHIDENS